MKDRRVWVAILISCILFVSLMVGCTANAATATNVPSTDVSSSQSETVAEPTTAPEAAPTDAPASSAEAAPAAVETTAQAVIPTPDFSSEQVFNPVAAMNSPESLEGSGVFPDNFFNSDILHTGARGCMSCHADLYTLVKNISVELHVASPATYGKPDDVKYCLTCHTTASALTGPKFGDIIHAFHENNTMFTDSYNGNCWSCHAVDVNGEMVLWDTVKYDATMWGYPGGSSDDALLTWEKMRGFPSGYLTGFATVEDMGLEVVSQ